MTVVPTEIWYRIAYYLPPSPVDYVDYALVSTSAKEVFMSDELWRAFTPVHETSDLARKYAKRVGNLAEISLKQSGRDGLFFLVMLLRMESKHASCAAWIGVRIRWT